MLVLMMVQSYCDSSSGHSTFENEVLMQLTPVLLCAAYLLVMGFGWWLRFINLRHLRQHAGEVPAGFDEALDPETLRKAARYTVEQSTLSLWESAFDTIILLLFLFGGLLPAYDAWISSVTDSFVIGNLLFLLILSLAHSLLSIPFSLYGTFRIENRFGFNRMTIGLWISDFIKSSVIGLVISAVLGAGALALVAWSPGYWWLWVWCLFAVASLFLMYLSPVLIEPLFNRFEPVKDDELKTEIVSLMERAGIEVRSVLQVDASRRSGHSNAYFTGIGRVKRIVLYDTLLQQMSRNEVLAVLAHEVGHWKKGHVWKRLASTEIFALLVCFLAYLLVSSEVLPGLFGLSEASFGAQLLLLGFLGSLVGFPLTPLGSWISRRHEWEADRYGAELSGMPEQLASALIKLSKENLANLHPHPLYARFYYSHPPVVERVRRLRGGC